MSKLDNLQQINTNVPRETLVYEADGLVIKRPVAGKMPNTTWLAKQKHAKEVVDSLKQIGNPVYYVPQMLEISTLEVFAIEQRAYGRPITSAFFETLTPVDHNIIYNAIAHFMNDINQMRPILKQSQFFDMQTEPDLQNLDFKTLLSKLKKYIPEKELKTAKLVKTWFDGASENDASVVFSHGDMNENNIFYNPEKRIVSFIDFADARYENAHYMFERDFAKLGWLDLNRIRGEYMALPRIQNVIISSDKTIEDTRNMLQSFKWSAIEFLKRPNIATNVRIKMIREYIQQLKEKYKRAIEGQQFAQGARALSASNKIIGQRSGTQFYPKQK